ncbi:MAG: Asp-tRNA(Asn)/Glu-tRNA(Gln) amidotransferase subunit GatC [Cytophagales bacterium]|nr:Asp-tRNA(Asn)/Glu-tRNA(Gln) amidotransferase subunit GatC [Cytophagales bacterium]
MKIDKKTVQKIAHLARLEFKDKDEEAIIKDLNKMLEWVGKLNELNTAGIEPLTHLSEEVNVMRKDELKKHISHEQGLKNAPKKDSDYFRVPKVLEAHGA